MQPLVSIIVPCYHSEKYIRQCVGSILAQTFEDWEAIFIVDDCDSDKTFEIITDYKDPRIGCIGYIGKTSPARARNLGITMSHGKYVSLLDADDWWEPRKLECVIPVMESNPRVCWAIHYIDYEYPDSTEHHTDNPLTERWVSGAAYATFRKDYLDAIKARWGYVFNESMSRSDDMDLTMRILDDPFIVIPEFLSHYQILDDSLTIRDSPINASWDMVKMTIRNRRYCDTPYYTKELLLSVFNRVTGLDVVKIWNTLK